MEDRLSLLPRLPVRKLIVVGFVALSCNSLRMYINFVSCMILYIARMCQHCSHLCSLVLYLCTHCILPNPPVYSTHHCCIFPNNLHAVILFLTLQVLCALCLVVCTMSCNKLPHMTDMLVQLRTSVHNYILYMLAYFFCINLLFSYSSIIYIAPSFYSSSICFQLSVAIYSGAFLQRAPLHGVL